MPRILHFGPGNFHRAHQAWYTQNAGGWTITAVSLQSATTRDALAGQGFDYTLVMRDAAGTADQLITAMDQILVAPEDPDAVLAQIADPEVQVITATVTEKGYHLDSVGKLVVTGAIAADIETGKPSTFIGYLAYGIAARQQENGGPLSVVSCDNLSHNGDKLRQAVLDFADAAQLQIDPSLLAFPNTMVDRITPRPTPELQADVQARTGRADASPVVTEVFSEWIIADDFAGPHPDWAAAGALFAQDVAPYEMRKLRMLNGAHSLLAYLGQLRGFTFVHEAIADADVRADVEALMNAAMVTLTGDAADLRAYKEALLDRFANPSLAHALAQIAMDGSQKMPIRCVEPLLDLRRVGEDGGAHIKALAAWVAFVQQADQLDDPQRAALRKAGSVEGILRVIAPDLAEDVVAQVVATVQTLRT